MHQAPPPLSHAQIPKLTLKELRDVRNAGLRGAAVDSKLFSSRDGEGGRERIRAEVPKCMHVRHSLSPLIDSVSVGVAYQLRHGGSVWLPLYRQTCLSVGRSVCRAKRPPSVGGHATHSSAPSPPCRTRTQPIRVRTNEGPPDAVVHARHRAVGIMNRLMAAGHCRGD